MGIKRAKHCREKLPIGTLRWRKRRHPNGRVTRVLMVRVSYRRDVGSLGWVNYSRHLYETHKGPVPPGKRVIHKDGDLTNHALDNLVLGTAADVLWVHCHKDPEKSANNHRVRVAVIAEINRQRAAIRRLTGPLPTRWYAVDPVNRLIINHAAEKLFQCAGFPPHTNGSGWIGWRLGWPGLQAAHACVLAVLVAAERPVSIPVLAGLVRDLRASLRITPATVEVSTLRTVAVSLLRAGWIHRARRGVYRAAPRAAKERGPVCPYLFLRGDQLGEEFAGFALVDPEGIQTGVVK